MGGLVPALLHRFQRFVTWLRGCPVLLVSAGRVFLDREGFRSSAVISYFALLSFLPFLLALLSVLGFVLAAAGGAHGKVEGEFLDSILGSVRLVLPFMRDNVQEKLRELILARQASGILGGVALVFASSLVFQSIEDALGRIFEGARSRHMVLSKLLFLGFVGGLGIFLLLSHYVMTFVNDRVVAKGGLAIYDYVTDSPVARLALSYVGTLIVFIAVIRVFSTVRFRWRWLLAGGSVFFLLWTVARVGFGIYLRTAAQFSVVYGSLSAIMILVFWVFYAASMFLYCAALIRVLQGDPTAPAPSDPVTTRTRRIRKQRGR